MPTTFTPVVCSAPLNTQMRVRLTEYFNLQAIWHYSGKSTYFV